MQGNRSQSTRTFTVTPPPTYSVALMVLLGGVLPVLIMGGMLWFGRMDRGGLIRILPAMFIVALVLGVSLLAMKRRSVALVDNVLDVRAALFRERTPTADIDLERARVDLRPALKTMGMSLPGFHAGRFRLRGKLVKAFCLITDRSRVLWLPLHNGKDQLLLSVERPQDLLDALRATMDGQARRS